MPSYRNNPVGEAENSLDRLHKGLGLRRSDLYTWLGPQLRQCWDIWDNTSIEVMRTQAAARISSAIVEHVDATRAKIALGYYNAAEYPELWPLKFSDRLDALHRRFGPTHSPSNIRRDARDIFLPRLKAALHATRTTRRPGHTNSNGEELRRVVRALNNPHWVADTAIRRFLDTPVYAPRSPTTGFQVAEPAGHGSWLCVFTTIDRYANYHRECGAPWADEPVRMTGAELVRELRRYPHCPGILLDPPVHEDAGPKDTLPIPPDIIERYPLNYD